MNLLGSYPGLLGSYPHLLDTWREGLRHRICQGISPFYERVWDLSDRWTRRYSIIWGSSGYLGLGGLSWFNSTKFLYIWKFKCVNMAQMVAVSLKEAEAPRFMRAAEGLQLSLPMTIKMLALQRLRQLEDGGPGAILGGE